MASLITDSETATWIRNRGNGALAKLASDLSFSISNITYRSLGKGSKLQFLNKRCWGCTPSLAIIIPGNLQGPRDSTNVVQTIQLCVVKWRRNPRIVLSYDFNATENLNSLRGRQGYSNFKMTKHGHASQLGSRLLLVAFQVSARLGGIEDIKLISSSWT